MTDITPLSRGAATESPEQKVSVPTEPRVPAGRQVTSVQPHPTPIIAATPAAEPVASDSDKRLHVAQMRSEISGTGALVDITV
jgi:hypothetical protein